MKRFATLSLGGVAFSLAVAQSFASTLILTATDTASIGPTGTTIVDNRLRAYDAGPTSSPGSVYDGFIKFNLSTIPSNATVTALTLTTYHEAGFSNPYGSPSVSVYRSDSDSWTRANPGGTYPGVDQLLMPAQTSFPTADLAPVTWTLSVSAFNISTDLNDGYLSLALLDRATGVNGESWVYFYGSDASPAPPQLTVTYSVSNVPEPSTWALFVAGSAAFGFSALRLRSSCKLGA